MRTASFFNVEPGEGRSASLMLLHSFFMGLATVFFETAASALFLARFSKGALPWVYLTAAVVNTATGLLYSAAQSRISFARLMTTTLLVLLVTTVGFRAGLAATGAVWLVFGLLVWYRVVSILTDLEYWAVAARLYDVRQAKRLFGLIGSGEVTARILGSFSVPLLVQTTGVTNLLLFSAASLALCVGLLMAVLRLMPAPSASTVGAKRAHDGPAAALRQLVGNRYLMLIVGVAAFAALGKYFVDFAFLEQMKQRYGGEKALASFFGIFSGVSQTLSLSTRLFLSGRVLGRWGVKLGLLILPAAHVLCTLVLVAAGLLPGAGAAIFWLVVLNQGIYKTLKHPIDNPSFKVLYQPLRREDRLAAQITVETIVTPLAIGVAGLVMLLFTVVLPYNPVLFSCALLVTFAGWMLAATAAGREYAGALVGALKGRIEDSTVDFDDDESQKVLERTLATGHPREVLFALQMLETTAPERMPALLPRLADHESPDVRLAALGLVERLKVHTAMEAAQRRMEADPAPDVRAAALRAFAAVGGPPVFEQLARHLEDPDPQVSMAALVGLLKQGSPFANTQLQVRAGSRNPRKRVWVARVLADAGPGSYHEPLLKLLRDEVPEVRRTALIAAGRLRNKDLWPAVLDALRDRAFCGAATSAFAAGGESAVPTLVAAFREGEPPPTLLRIARLLARIGTPLAKTALARQSAHPNAAVRHEVLRSLAGMRFQPDEPGRLALAARVRGEAKDVAWLMDVRGDLAVHEDLALLRTALEHETERARDRLLLVLSFLYDSRAILSAREHRSDVSREKRAYALEILDVTLSAEDKDLVMPVLGDAAPLASDGSHEARVARLQELLDAYPARTSSWTQACTLEAVVRTPSSGLISAVETLTTRTRTALLTQMIDQTIVRLKAPTAEQLAAKGRTTHMRTIEKVITLKSVDMFSRADDDVLADVASILEEVEWKAGQLIFKKGDPGDSMYIIVEGRVRVFDGEHTIVQLGARDIFGELALLDPEPRFASVEALTEVRLFRLDREAFLELMAGNIDIVRGVLHVLCERLRRAVREHGPYPDRVTLTPPGR
jgi:AAA family ATP:ADP antiporter